ncbi:MAG: hypothetical protein ACR2OX_02495, partial [Methyloligellaceae bacterium]
TTVAVRWDAIDWPTLEAGYAALETAAAEVIAETGLDPKTAEITRLADMRYVGQGFEVVVTLPEGPYGPGSANAIETAFEESYRQLFSRIPPDVVIEIINIRVSMRAAVPGPGIAFKAAAGGPAEAKSSRKVYFPEHGDFVDTPVYAREMLPGDATLSGPAIVEESESTLVVGPNATIRVDACGNLIVDLLEG